MPSPVSGTSSLFYSVNLIPVSLSYLFQHLSHRLFHLIMAILRSRCGHYMFVLFLSFFLLFSSPNLSGRRLNVYHTCLSANLERRSEMFCTRPLEMQDPKIAKNSPYWHYGEILSGYIFATKARIDNRKKSLLNSNTSPTCPLNLVNLAH